jgi:hypothetical protein
MSTDNVVPFPPRPIVAQEPKPLITIDDIKLSPTLLSKLESLRADIMICETKDCGRCTERKRRFDMVVEQIKAEFVGFYDLKNKINMFTDNYAALASYVDMQETPGRAQEVIEEYKKSHIQRIK